MTLSQTPGRPPRTPYDDELEVWVKGVPGMFRSLSDRMLESKRDGYLAALASAEVKAMVEAAEAVLLELDNRMRYEHYPDREDPREKLRNAIAGLQGDAVEEKRRDG